MYEWDEDGPQGTVSEERQDPISTSCFYLSEQFPTYFKVFHTFHRETVYYF